MTTTEYLVYQLLNTNVCVTLQYANILLASSDMIPNEHSTMMATEVCLGQ